jgi:uncharacterized protein YhdP
VPVSNVKVTDSGTGQCSPLAGPTGDANGNGMLDLTETWVYTCTKVYTDVGTFPNVATANGTYHNQPVPPSSDHQSVTTTAPPVPQAAPKPAAQAVAAPVAPASVPQNCIAKPKSLSLRAKEVTNVKVTLDQKTKGVTVKVKGPGINRTGHTNSKGQVTFKVRPTRAGTLTITTPQCAQASKSVVKAARKTQSRQLPKVTG